MQRRNLTWFCFPAAYKDASFLSMTIVFVCIVRARHPERREGTLLGVVFPHLLKMLRS